MEWCCILLAAGMASRMKRVKALLPLPFPHQPISALVRLTRLYSSLGARIIVVTGYHAGNIENELRQKGLHHVWTVRNPHPEQGMFSSLLTGLAAVPSSCAWCAVHPVDVPLVRSFTLKKLLETAASCSAQEPEVLIPSFASAPGHPVFLPASFFPAIRAHDGSYGLQGALAPLPQRSIPVADATMLDDMDTPDDYEKLCQRAEHWNTLTPVEAWELLCLHQVSEAGLWHGRAVGRVAEALTCALNAHSDTPLSPALSLAGGLLHDIAKGEKKHELCGGSLLLDLGLPHLARLVASHGDCSIADDAPITEQEVVYLADKLCRGGHVVGIGQRFDEKLAQYANNAEACRAIQQRKKRALAFARRFENEALCSPESIAHAVIAQLPPLAEDPAFS